MNSKLGKYRVDQNLSSRTFFHFTKSFEILKKILENGFQARYVYEKLPGLKLAYFTKTVCFCDIPLGAIKEHINWYGDFGIGINREIAREQGVTPVFYIHSKTPIFPNTSSTKSSDWFRNFLFTRCLKQVFGKQFFIDNTEKPFKVKKFYNEKEWRYFPNNSETKILYYEDEKELVEERNELNDRENKDFFEIKDPVAIEYILIKDASYLEKLKKILGKNKYESNRDELLTKVITIDQVIKDF